MTTGPQRSSEDSQAAYAALHRSGTLRERAGLAWQRLGKCDLCPHNCGANRLAGEKGICRTGAEAVVASFGPHFGEERPLVGYGGSGTIFFSHCNLKCQFCQNYEISQEGEGREASAGTLADFMLQLQQSGCHNINLVSPSHVVPQFLAALVVAAENGLRVPIVYNTGGYDSLETLALLDGIVDIYMPDMKYDEEETARLYSGISDYPAVNRAAVREMHRQVGDLITDEKGIARRGLLVRHLVLPQGQAGTRRIVDFLAGEISRDTYLNIMDQYRPCYRAGALPALNRCPTRDEYRGAIQLALAAGMSRLDSH